MDGSPHCQDKGLSMMYLTSTNSIWPIANYLGGQNLSTFYLSASVRLLPEVSWGLRGW